MRIARFVWSCIYYFHGISCPYFLFPCMYLSVAPGVLCSLKRVYQKIISAKSDSCVTHCSEDNPVCSDIVVTMQKIGRRKCVVNSRHTFVLKNIAPSLYMH